MLPRAGHIMASLARSVAEQMSTLSSAPLEVTQLELNPYQTSAALQTNLVSPAAGSIYLSRLPSVIMVNRPLELEFAVAGAEDIPASSSVASCISAHTILSFVVTFQGYSSVFESVRVSVRPSVSRYIARVLIRPASWTNATSITVASLSHGWLSSQADCLPATLRVGYSHDLVPEGRVSAAAKAGDVAALQAALDAGGSTEEADIVRARLKQCFQSDDLDHSVAPLPHLLEAQLLDGWTGAFWAAERGHVEVIRLLIAAGADVARADVVSE